MLKSNRNTSLHVVRILFLLLICALSVTLILPTLYANIYNPNKIYYHNADEGGLMDLVWYYYTGEKRQSFLFDFDSGLELVYTADFIKLLPSHITKGLTPGSFVLILRWVHMIAWVCSIIALWYLIGYHFGRGWKQMLGISLLALRPAFAYLQLNLKPEPLVILFVIIGLHYLLKMIDNVSLKNFVVPIIMSALAFAVKYAGVFLLVPIIVTLYLLRHYHYSGLAKERQFIFPTIRYSYFVYALLGLLLSLLPMVSLVFYVRKATGRTWYADYGLIGSLIRNKIGIALLALGVFLVLLSVIFFLMDKAKRSTMKRFLQVINELNSYIMYVICSFFAIMIIIGIKWIIKPELFIISYSQLFPIVSASGRVMILSSFLLGELKNLWLKFGNLDIIIFVLFILYVILEVYNLKDTIKTTPTKMYKRLILLSFLVPFLAILLLPIRTAQHHMLPFFAAMSILAMEGVDMLKGQGKGLKKSLCYALYFLLALDIAINGYKMLNDRIYTIKSYSADISLDIEEWFHKNIPVNSTIISDHFLLVYMPPGYKNVKIFNSCTRENVIGQIRALVSAYKPQYVYYNMNSGGCEPLPAAEIFLGDFNPQLVKEFDNSWMSNQVKPQARFVLYSLTPPNKQEGSK